MWQKEYHSKELNALMQYFYHSKCILPQIAFSISFRLLNNVPGGENSPALLMAKSINNLMDYSDKTRSL